MPRKILSLRLASAAVALILALQACGTRTATPEAGSTSSPVPSTQAAGPSATGASGEPAPAASPTATTPIVHTQVPGDPPDALLSAVSDHDSSVTAAEHRTTAGDDFSQDLFERPFNAETMDTYFPDLDIKLAEFSEDDTWAYVSIQLVGAGSGGELKGNYAAELDLNVDGRGDLLVAASAIQDGWTTDGVRVWRDKNHDNGGAHPLSPDAPQHGDGFETQLFDQGHGDDPDSAWARISPDDPATVQLAFKLTLLNGSDKFTWGAWADEGVFDPARFDYNDSFSEAQAGSPLTEQADYYPLKALFELDNTCRWGVGFTPNGHEPGVCPVAPPPTRTPRSRPTATPRPNGFISGRVWHDVSQNGKFNQSTDTVIGGVNIRVWTGNCSSPGENVEIRSTDAAGTYTVSVPPGQYCVDVDSIASYTNRSPAITVMVHSGGSVTANFWFWTVIAMFH